MLKSGPEPHRRPYGSSPSALLAHPARQLPLLAPPGEHREDRSGGLGLRASGHHRVSAVAAAQQIAYHGRDLVGNTPCCAPECEGQQGGKNPVAWGCGPCAPSAQSARLTADCPLPCGAYPVEGDQQSRHPAGDAPAGCCFARPMTASPARTVTRRGAPSEVWGLRDRRPRQGRLGARPLRPAHGLHAPKIMAVHNPRRNTAKRGTWPTTHHRQRAHHEVWQRVHHGVGHQVSTPDSAGTYRHSSGPLVGGIPLELTSPQHTCTPCPNETKEKTEKGRGGQPRRRGQASTRRLRVGPASDPHHHTFALSACLCISVGQALALAARQCLHPQLSCAWLPPVSFGRVNSRPSPVRRSR